MCLTTSADVAKEFLISVELIKTSIN